MVTPRVQQTLDSIFGPLDVVVVDRHVPAIVEIPLAHPLTEGVLPVAEVVLVEPLGPVRQARVVVAVLRASHGVHVKEHLDVVLLGHVEEPLDLVLGALSAANVGAVGLQSPVSDRNSDDFNLAISHSLEGLLSDPVVPVVAEDSVSLLGAEGLAESVLVHADTLRVRLAQEAVEQRRRDPGLKHLPSTDVGANHGAATGGRRNGSCCKGSERESLHELF